LARNACKQPLAHLLQEMEKMPENYLK